MLNTTENSYCEAPKVHVPERNLLSAILEMAIRDFLNGGEWRETAIAWFAGEETEGFSFEFVIQELDICSERFFKSLETLKKFRI